MHALTYGVNYQFNTLLLNFSSLFFRPGLNRGLSASMLGSTEGVVLVEQSSD